MKKRLTFLVLFIMLTFCSLCQVFPTEVLVNNGPSNTYIDLVFLSDGYQANEMTLFIQDVQKITTNIFNQSPFKEYKNYFNVIAIKVPSNQSGANHPKTAPDCGNIAVTTADNYFGSSFDSFNIHRLLVPTKNVGSVLASSYPLYDQAFVVVNSSVYGGSGGSYATASTDPSSAEVAIHEIGHSFAALADEYWAGPQYAAEKPNMTQQSAASAVKWKNWVGTGGVGVYPHAESPTWYRPHQNCKMRFLGVPFCGVCVETFLDRMQTMTNPIQSFSPSGNTVNITGNTALPFSLALVKPEPNTLKITWKANGSVVANKLEAVNLSLSTFPQIQNTLRAEVVDTIALSRKDDRLTVHLHVVTWTINNPNGTITGVEISSSEQTYKIETFPNPITDKLYISYTLPAPSDVRITFTDESGRTVKNLINEKQAAGTYDYDLPTSHLNLQQAGMYLMRLEIDGAMVTRKIIKN